MSEVEQRLGSIEASIRRIERVVNLVLVKRPSRKEQAKLAGVSPVTLWRREKKLRLEQLANGSSRKVSL
jgi:hypothetical protein